MNLIEKWKSRETKKNLREENIRLKAEIDLLHRIPAPPVCTIERNIQKVCGAIEVGKNNSDIPEEWIKGNIARNMAGSLAPFIEYDFQDNGLGGKIYIGTLYVATGDRNHGIECNSRNQEDESN